MRKKIMTMCILIFLLLLLLPAVQMLTNIIPETTLHGVTAASHSPSFSLKNFFNGSLQSEIDTWWQEHLGLRNAMIKTDNQLNFSLFHEASGSKNSELVLGKNNMLYEKGYIDALNNRTRVSDKYLEHKVQQLKFVQDELKKRDIAFLFVVAPSKAARYEEFIPAAYLDPKRHDQASNYEQMKQYLDAYDIDYVDSADFVEKQKTFHPYPLFAHGGTHWSYYTVTRVAQLLISRLEQQTGQDYPNVLLDQVIVDNKPDGYDRDIAELLNIWDSTATNGPTPHPIFHRDGGEVQPNVLFVGDSFVWQLLEILDGVDFYSKRNFYYYFSRDKAYPQGTFTNIEKEDFDWEANVLNRDVVIVEIVENGADQMWFGFVDGLSAYFQQR